MTNIAETDLQYGEDVDPQAYSEVGLTMKKYPEYQDSGVDWIENIPVHWHVKRFKNLFQIKKDIVGVLGFDVLSITQKGIKVKDIESGEGQVASDYSKYQKVKVGDFAMNHMDLLTGFVDLSRYDGVTSPDYRVFSLEDRASSKNYYLYILQLCYTHKIFYPLGQGAAHVGRWRLPADAFKKFRAPYPPYNEQVKITRYLDRETARIDNLIAEKQNFIKLLKEKRQALISHVVTKGLDPNVRMKNSGVEWIGDVPSTFGLIPFTKYICNQTDYRGKTPNKTDSGIFLVTAKNIKMGFIDYDSSKEFISEEDYEDVMRRGKPEVGDILFTTEAPLGNVALVDDHSIALAQRVIRFRMKSNEIEEKFALYSMMSDFFQTQINQLSTGITAKGIKASKLNQLRIFKPNMMEQKSIVDFIDKEDKKNNKLIAEVECTITLLKEHRTALISAAVTGKIDVRDQV